MSRAGGRIGLLALAAAAALCWFAAVRSGLGAMQVPQVTSLRYSSPQTTVGRLAQIRQAQSREAGDRTAFAAFVQRESQTIRTKEYEKSATADVLLFSGDLRLILNPRGMTGSFSTSADVQGCAMDADTAYRLWGSDNVLGERVEYGDREYVVRAVFRSPKGVALFSADDDAEQQMGAVSLDTRGSLNPAGDAESFRSRFGLPQADAVVSGGWISAAARLLMLLPAVALGLVLLGKMLRELWAMRGTPVLFALWCAGIAAAVAAAFIASGIRLSVPQSLIPTRWSDFEFWSRTFADWWDNVRRVFSSPRLVPDVVVSSAFAGLGLASAAATAMLLLLFRNMRRE